MTEFFVDIALYTGQHLQSESYVRRVDAQRCQRALVACTMIETLCVISTATGEVFDRMDSLTVHASSGRYIMPR